MPTINAFKLPILEVCHSYFKVTTQKYSLFI